MNIQKILREVKEKLSGYGEESHTFNFYEEEWEVKIEYDPDAENPLTAWDHPKGSGIDLNGTDLSLNTLK